MTFRILNFSLRDRKTPTTSPKRKELLAKFKTYSKDEFRLQPRFRLMIQGKVIKSDTPTFPTMNHCDSIYFTVFFSKTKLRGHKVLK